LLVLRAVETRLHLILLSINAVRQGEAGDLDILDAFRESEQPDCDIDFDALTSTGRFLTVPTETLGETDVTDLAGSVEFLPQEHEMRGAAVFVQSVRLSLCSSARDAHPAMCRRLLHSSC
jgi:hypothetical protein